MLRRPRPLRFFPSPMVIPLWYNRSDWWKLTMALTSWTRLRTEYIRRERKRSERTANDLGRLSIKLHPLESGHFETRNFVTRIRVHRALITTLESGSCELIHWFWRVQKPKSIRLKKCSFKHVRNHVGVALIFSTYPSLKPTLTLTSHLEQNVGLGEG